VTTTPKPCGTYAAHRRHQRNGEPVDAACRAAYNAHQREMYRRRNGQQRTAGNRGSAAELDRLIQDAA